ncbi:MAG: ABC transporter substrate-binding protein [Solirubrobacteraceae bacterium]|nr:ABC transporter substrate-binding protein [Patulibacter sp.]
MNRSRILVGTALASTALLTAGCGSGSDSGNAGSKEPIQSGGTLTGYYSNFPDSLDPALAFTSNSFQVMWPVYGTLLTYKRGAGAAASELTPGLASAMPDISADGTGYTLTLRPGLTYSDGSAVKASDFEHEIKRVLQLQSGGATYYGGIQGVDAYTKAGKADGDISGITANDATGTIRIRLTAPDAQFKYKLALPFAALVPGDTPFKDETKTPPPGVGPLSITNVQDRKGFSLQKVASFKALPDVPVASADRIDISIVSNQRRQAQDVLQNKVDFINDPPPADQLRILREQAKGRYAEYTTNSTYYYFLNVQAKPFDDPLVRQAVATAVDERALARLFSGLLEPDCNLLAPGMVGYKKLNPCPYGAIDQAPDIAKAKALIQQSGHAGESITVWSDDQDPSPAVANYMADLLNQIGLKAKPKSIDGDSFYNAVSDQSTKAQIGVYNWFEDYPHPQSFLQLVDGKAITPTYNINLSNENDPALNALIKKGDSYLDVHQGEAAFEQADALAVKDASVIPYGHRKLTVITSDRVAFGRVFFSPVYQLDFSSLALKATK